MDQPDHVRVRDAALRGLASRPDVTLRFFADLPYAAATPGWSGSLTDHEARRADPLATALRDVEERVGPLERARCLEVEGSRWVRKRQAVLAHASQLALVGAMDEVSMLGPLLAPGGPLRVEMVWGPR